MKRVTLLCLVALPISLSPVIAFAQVDLIQVHQDFSQDPGWEWKSNRVVAENPPTIKQDFGWRCRRSTSRAGPA
jgi:hypothetical protein